MAYKVFCPTIFFWEAVTGHGEQAHKLFKFSEKPKAIITAATCQMTGGIHSSTATEDPFSTSVS